MFARCVMCIFTRQLTCSSMLGLRFSLALQMISELLTAQCHAPHFPLFQALRAFTSGAQDCHDGAESPLFPNAEAAEELVQDIVYSDMTRHLA